MTELTVERMADANRGLELLVFGYIRRIEYGMDINVGIPQVIHDEIWRFHSVKLYIAGFMRLNKMERYFTLNYKNEMAYYYNKGDKYALESFHLSEITSMTYSAAMLQIKTKEIDWDIECPSIRCREEWVFTLQSLIDEKESGNLCWYKAQKKRKSAWLVNLM